MHLFRNIFKWTGIGLIGIGCAFAILVVVRAFHFYNLDKTNEQVAIIHATKLTLDDVMGKNLPPDPGAEADKTIQGIDANQNGIRDDVELSIFKEYPDSAKTRAELLQYALTLQMMVIQPSINREVATSIIQEKSRAYDCVGETISKNDLDVYLSKVDNLLLFIENRQLNTFDRIEFDKNFYEKVDSYSESEKKACDVDFL